MKLHPCAPSSLLARALAALATCAAGTVAAQPADSATGYPTVERVLYVQECMRAHPGPFYEMVNKCSCAVDALAREVSYDDYVTMSTAANANSISGERGNVIRDTEVMQVEVRRFRTLQTKVQKSCFLSNDAK